MWYLFHSVILKVDTITSADTPTVSITDGASISGVTTFSSDINIADKIVHTGDTNTAIRFPSADTIQFETSGTNRLRIDSSGNIGAGTLDTTIDEALCIERAGNVTVMAECNASGSGANAAFRLKSADSSSDWYMQTGNETSGGLRFYDGTDSATRLIIDGNGRVGINETSPDNMLHVRNDNSAAAKIGGEGGSAYYMEIGQLAASGSPGFNATGSSTSMLFQLNGSEKMRLNSSGYVGVGTNSPGILVDVRGTGPALASFQTKDGTTDSQARISLGALGINPPWQRGINLVAENNGAGHDFLVQTSNSHSAGPTEKLRVESSGDVGIGTAAATARCHIFTASGSGGIQFGTAGYNSYIYGIQSNDNLSNGTLAGELGIRGKNGVAISGNDGTACQVHVNSNGLCLGGTGASNGLTDYEEGDHTAVMTLGSGSVSNTHSNTLSYTKVGRLVTVTGRLYVTLSASDVTSFQFTLPFTCADGGTKVESMSVLHVFRATAQSNESNEGERAFRIDGNTNYAKMVDRDNGSYGEFGVTNPHIGVNFQYYAAT